MERIHSLLDPQAQAQASGSSSKLHRSSASSLTGPPALDTSTMTSQAESSQDVPSPLFIDPPRTQTTSKGGCWTCRLRRKKCDEQREGDTCQTCKRLGIICLGWGAKRPDWMRDKKAVDEYKAGIKDHLQRVGLIREYPRPRIMHSRAPPARPSMSVGASAPGITPPTPSSSEAWPSGGHGDTFFSYDPGLSHATQNLRLIKADRLHSAEQQEYERDLSTPNSVSWVPRPYFQHQQLPLQSRPSIPLPRPSIFSRTNITDSGERKGPCAHCKKMKLKCESRPGERCTRCKERDLACLAPDWESRGVSKPDEPLTPPIGSLEVVTEPPRKKLRSYSVNPQDRGTNPSDQQDILEAGDTEGSPAPIDSLNGSDWEAEDLFMDLIDSQGEASSSNEQEDKQTSPPHAEVLEADSSLRVGNPKGKKREREENIMDEEMGNDTFESIDKKHYHKQPNVFSRPAGLQRSISPMGRDQELPHFSADSGGVLGDYIPFTLESRHMAGYIATMSAERQEGFEVETAQAKARLELRELRKVMQAEMGPRGVNRSLAGYKDLSGHIHEREDFSLRENCSVGYFIEGGGAGKKVFIEVLRVDQKDEVKACLIQKAPIWQQLKHNNVLEFIGLSFDSWQSGDPALVYPYCFNGTLSRYGRHGEVNMRLFMIKNVSEGLRYLHDMHVIHGDLQPSRIFVHDDGHPVISGFGYPEILAIAEDNSLYKPREERCYQAQELAIEDGIHPNKASDVCAFALTAYEIWTGIQPFEGAVRELGLLSSNDSKGTTPGYPDPEPPGTKPLWQLFEDCWGVDPDGRLTMKEVAARLLSIHDPGGKGKSKLVDDYNRLGR